MQLRYNTLIGVCEYSIIKYKIVICCSWSYLVIICENIACTISILIILCISNRRHMPNYSCILFLSSSRAYLSHESSLIGRWILSYTSQMYQRYNMWSLILYSCTHEVIELRYHLYLSKIWACIIYRLEGYAFSSYTYITWECVWDTMYQCSI